METKPIFWSYSRLTAYETCPRQFYLTKVAKTVKEKPSVQMLWGNKGHKALEDRVESQTPLPEDMKKWEPLAAKFDGKKAIVEYPITLTKNLTETDWFAKDAWLRTKIDVGIETPTSAVLADWKTGKIKDDSGQMKLTAAVWMQIRPLVQKVTTMFIWLVNGKATKETFTRPDTPAIWQDFNARVARMDHSFQTGTWVPKPSGLCNGWCPVGKDHCEFWRPKK